MSKTIRTLLIVCATVLAAPLLPAQHRFGYVPDHGKVSPPFLLKRGVAAASIKPASDLTPHMPLIWDQGNLGACTGFGVARVLDYAHNLRRGSFYTPSTLFIYYEERVLEGTVHEDAGAMIADGLTVVARKGAPSERCWPYIIQRFDKKPSARCYVSALNKQAVRYYKVDNGDGTSIRRALSLGFPVVFGCYVYQPFMGLNRTNYKVTGPSGAPVGGHCMVITGHDDASGFYTVDNSWGTEWGNSGRCLMAYSYIHNRRITDDCWVIELAE